MEQTIYQLATGAHFVEDPRNWTAASVGAATMTAPDCAIDISWRKASMQNQIGCCVGCTYEEIVALILYQVYGIVSNPGTDTELSFRFVYAICKALDGIAGEGTFPSLAAKVIRDYGIPLAKFCPNDTKLDHESFVYGRDMANIPAEAIKDALTRKAGADVVFPATIDGLKRAVTYAKANNGGVAILRDIGNTYWTAPNGISSWDATGQNAILPIRTTPNIVSGHEEMVYAYETEQATGRVKVRWLNHWSSQWADNGRGWEYADVWMPYVREIRVTVPVVPVSDTFKYQFTKQLSPGSQGPDVVALQHALKIDGEFPVATPFSTNFGPQTKAAVIAFQNKYAADILAPAGLKQGNGLVGPHTLAKLNSLFNK